jgi:hypothetical protein
LELAAQAQQTGLFEGFLDQILYLTPSHLRAAVVAVRQMLNKLVRLEALAAVAVITVQAAMLLVALAQRIKDTLVEMQLPLGPRRLAAVAAALVPLEVMQLLVLAAMAVMAATVFHRQLLVLL